MSSLVKIGIVGYGDFSKVLIEHLSEFAEIVVSSRSKNSGDAGFGARFADVSEVLSCPIIIPSIPSQFIEGFFEKNKQLVNPDALVIDIASIKVQPINALLRQLPESCRIIGIHAMFGPGAISRNGGKIAGLKCVVSPVRIDKTDEEMIVGFMEETLGLKVIYRTPEEHDREMAYVQGLTHLIGRVLDEMKIPDSELSTLAYDNLMEMKRVQGQDSWDLFCSIIAENPYTKDIQEQFMDAYKVVRDRASNTC